MGWIYDRGIYQNQRVKIIGRDGEESLVVVEGCADVLKSFSSALNH